MPNPFSQREDVMTIEINLPEISPHVVAPAAVAVGWWLCILITDRICKSRKWAYYDNCDPYFEAVLCALISPALVAIAVAITLGCLLGPLMVFRKPIWVWGKGR
jgi:hypothetical protein